MNPTAHNKPSHEEAIEATAAAWLAQRDAGLSPAEATAFAQWRQADARHEAAAARLETAWSALAALRDFRPEARVHPDRDLLARPRFAGLARVVPFPARAAALAAAALVLAALWSSWPLHSANPAPANEPVYATTTGGYQRVTLADGSVLELNASSEVRVHYAPAERRVRLVRGEAHFTVAKNKARPFIVEAGAVAVRAVGTAFDVRLQPGAVEVLVTEGRVQVEELGRIASPAALPTLGAYERMVVPVQSALGVTAPVAAEKITAETIREELAWQGPRLVFADTPLAQVVAEFNRRNQVQLVLADAELGALPVGGSFRAENVEAFVRLIASGGDIVVERPAPDRIVLRKAP